MFVRLLDPINGKGLVVIAGLIRLSRIRRKITGGLKETISFIQFLPIRRIILENKFLREKKFIA